MAPVNTRRRAPANWPPARARRPQIQMSVCVAGAARQRQEAPLEMINWSLALLATPAARARSLAPSRRRAAGVALKANFGRKCAGAAPLSCSGAQVPRPAPGTARRHASWPDVARARPTLISPLIGLAARGGGNRFASEARAPDKGRARLSQGRGYPLGPGTNQRSRLARS